MIIHNLGELSLLLEVATKWEHKVATFYSTFETPICYLVIFSRDANKQAFYKMYKRIDYKLKARIYPEGDGFKILIPLKPEHAKRFK